MKKLYLTLVLSCSLMLMTGIAWAADCVNVTCQELGYTTTGINSDCSKTLSCPFDSTYSACITYRTFANGSCPANASICNSRYKITSCKSGYTLSQDRTKCVANSNSGDGCLTEAEAIAGCTSYKTVSTGCYACCTGAETNQLTCKIGSPIKDDSTNCAKSSCPTGAVCNSSNVVTGCEEGYTVSTGSNSCKTCTFSGYTSLTEACAKCNYKAHHVTGGYVCGVTATSGYVKCMNGTPCFTKQEALWVCGSKGVKGNITSSEMNACYECCTSLTDTNCIKP